MIKKIGILANVLKPKALNFCGDISSYCKKNNISVFTDKSLSDNLKYNISNIILSENNFDEMDLVLILGGDGFLLSSAKSIYPSKVPILPVNLGKLGFNSILNPGDLFGFLDKYKDKKIPTQKRMMFQTQIIREGNIVFDEIGLNEIVIIKETHSRMIVFDLFIDNSHICEYKADGIIVATPTGSTAYNLSAGGPIIYPSIFSFVISPICPHSLTSRSIVIPESSEIELRQKVVKTHEDIIAIVDGHQSKKIIQGDRIITKKTDSYINIICEDHMHFYNNLKEKILWGGFPDE